jgi:hypothetical protein
MKHREQWKVRLMEYDCEYILDAVDAEQAAELAVERYQWSCSDYNDGRVKVRVDRGDRSWGYYDVVLEMVVSYSAHKSSGVIE